MQDRGSLEVLTTDDSAAWQEVLEQVELYDFYHLPAYHRLAEIRGEGKAVLPVYREQGHVVAMPLLLREIDVPGAGEGLKDATSVYGYPGPIASSESVPPDVLERFTSALQEFFESQCVVAAFSRLHPLLENQARILAGYGEVVEVGVTVSVDLTLPPDMQVARYRRDHRRQVRMLKEAGLVAEEVGTECLEDFLQIYYDTMDKLNAESSYYFDRSYFEYLMCEMPEIMHLFIGRDGEKITCAGIFSICRGIVQFHLSGTANEYRRSAPMKVAVDTVRQWGNQMGAHTFHLGGGLGAQRDSLYEFKVGFSGREHEFRVWRHVADPTAYRELCDAVTRLNGAEPSGSSFPRYRCPVRKSEKVQINAE